MKKRYLLHQLRINTKYFSGFAYSPNTCHIRLPKFNNAHSSYNLHVWLDGLQNVLNPFERCIVNLKKKIFTYDRFTRTTWLLQISTNTKTTNFILLFIRI